MNWVDAFLQKLVDRIMGNGSDAENKLIRIVHIDLGKPSPRFKHRIQRKPYDIKVVTALVNEKVNPLPIADYLSSVAGLEFTMRESEMRYGGAYYLAGKKDEVTVRIVPTARIFEIPKKYREEGWLYLSITCDPDDNRFDAFPGYEVIPASKYNL